MNQRISVNAGVTRQQQDTRKRLGRCFLGMIIACLFAAIAPELAFAGASPFTTGATAASTNLLAILTPIAVVAVMALGAAAWFNLRSSTNIAVGLSFPLVGSLAGDSQLIVGALDELLTRAWR